nr:ribonuclease H-like domain-containing protein [Tanacetum cinerariifolium]
MDNVVEVTSPESTTPTLSSFEEYTPPLTYSEEVEKTLRTPIEIKPLNETKLEEVGLNCNHDTPLSSRKVPSFDKPEPQPQPLPDCPPLDANIGTERDDPERHYGFKTSLLEQSESLDVDFSNIKEIEDDFLGRGFSLPMKPKDLEKVIRDEKKLESS